MNSYATYFFLLLLGLGVGYSISSLTGESPSMTMPTSDTTHQANSMPNHAQTEVDTTQPIPKVRIEAMKDAKDGYNIHIMTEDFVWTPEKVNEAINPGEGHAHIYVDGVKIARVYSSWFHLPSSSLHGGANTIEVTLNANDHSEWVKGGAHIAAEATVTK